MFFTVLKISQYNLGTFVKLYLINTKAVTGCHKQRLSLKIMNRGSWETVPLRITMFVTIIVAKRWLSSHQSRGRLLIGPMRAELKLMKTR